MPRVIWSASAVADLSTIRHWLVNEAGQPIALRILRDIRTQTGQLGTFPAVGSMIDHRQRKLRLRGTSYIMIYQILDGQAVVLRIRHAHEDWRPAS